MTTPDPEIVKLLKIKHADVSEREALLFEHLYRAWPYIPDNLVKTAGENDGKRVIDVMNDDIERMYGLRFRLPEGESTDEHRKKLRRLHR